MNCVRQVCVFGDRTLCVCNYCAFVVDNNNEVQFLTKNHGLSSAYVSCGCADEDGKFWAVGYLDGSLDVCVNSSLSTIPDVSLGNYIKDRRINFLSCNQNLIVAGCDFGVSVINVDKMEVSATCSFDEPVRHVFVKDNMIYAFTKSHTYSISADDYNLQDPERWAETYLYYVEEDDDTYNTLVANTIPSDSVYDISTMDGKVVLTSDYYTEILSGGITRIKNPDSQNFTCSFFNPYNSNHVFLGSEDGTLYEYLDHSVKATYNDRTYLPKEILDMECTLEGDLFILMDGQVSVFDHDGKWHIATSFSPIKYLSPTKILKVSDYVFWILCGTNGIFAINLNSTPLDFSDDSYVTFYPKTSSGERVGAKVTELDLDNSGRVWIGTDKGAAFISNPDNVFSDSYFFVRPIITETSERDGDYSQYLLSSKYITSIQCDSKSRKWISTLGAGVFVVDDLGEEECFHFNERNSGLPGDSIRMSKYIGKTGEIFFQTNCGLASYLTDTQDTEDDLSNVRVYPNPVRPDYSGEIYISGLEDGCDIRITDIAGHLVYKTKSEGGKVSWDGRNLLGNRCATGVYLIFIVNVNSRNTSVKKLLMVK